MIRPIVLIASLPLLLAGSLGDARRQLGMGQPAIAERSYRTLLAHDPDDGEAMVGLARAQSRQGRCDEAFEVLGRARALGHWTAGAALAEGGCALTTGQYARAEVAFLEAAQVDPDSPGALYGLARVYLAWGDVEAYEAALEALEATPNSRAMPAVLRADRALSWGGEPVEPALDALRATLGPGRVSAAMELRGFEASHHLALGQAGRVLDDLESLIRHPAARPEIAAYVMEASRRLGYVATARRLANGPRFSDHPLPLLLAMRARVLTDMGALDEAALLLADLGDSDHPEVLASRWYLARAQGDADARERLAARWRGAVHRPDLSLDMLLTGETP